MSKVKFESEGRLGVITIDSPPVNALDKQLLGELSDVLDGIGDRVDAVIVTGAGDKAFVAGADIKEFPELRGEAGVALCRKGQLIFQKLADLKQPTIAAIDGYALGGGLELALACDFRVATEKSVLGLPETSLGVIPGYGGTQRLARLIGPGKAKQLIFTAEAVKAEEACRLGMVEVLAEGDVVEAAKAEARKILTRGPLAVQAAKRAVNGGLEKPLEEGLKLEAEQFGSVCDSEDKNEGAAAFIEKRKPNFQGR
ncbi:MAG TPA: enoyl-CoA hydratase-related protein [Bacillales bacterium]|nr:enoyl-CoA hydratase-related protein [Bacillales bacterium]